MKKFLVLFFLVFLAVFSVFSTGNPYDSDVLLEKYYNELKLDSFSENYWNNVKISLVTMSKGADLTSIFGHTGICIDLPDGFTSYVFDYGRFSFETQTALDFFVGDLWYWCGGSYTPSVIEGAKAEERTVSKVELNLSPSSKQALVDFVETNCSEDLRQFFYKPFTDNCSTRVRDVINRATDGEFKKWAMKYEGLSFRTQAEQVVSDRPLALWFSDAMLGEYTDTPTTVWDEMFLPVNLEKGVLNFDSLASAQEFMTLEEKEEENLNFIQKLPPSAVYAAVSAFLVIVSLLIFRCRRIWSAFTFVFILISALLGTAIFAGMFFTRHDFFLNNENIVLINPLLFVVAAFSFNREKHRTVLAVFYSILSAASLLLLLLKLTVPAVLFQNNWYQMVIYVPFYFVNACLLSSQRRNDCTV